MPIINWKDGTINYTDEGKGTTVLLLHGFCESLMMWEDWKYDLLEEQYRVVTVDLPGFGASTATSKRIAEMATAVEKVVSTLGLKKVICVGHSMGGYVAIALAKEQPDWLFGLGIFHSHPYADTAEQREARQKSMDFIRRNGHIHYVKQLIPRLFAHRTGSSASFRRDTLILRASKASADSIINALEAMRDRPDHSEVLTNYNRPVLFINGVNDPIYTIAQRQDQLALPAVSQVCALERSGHMGMIEEKQRTQRVVRQFVQFCEDWKGSAAQK